MSVAFSFTIPESQLPPHFMLGRPVTGFAGVHFLEEGLAAGTIYATERFEELLKIQLDKVFRSTPRIRAGSGSSILKAGIAFSVVENVSNLSNVDVRKSLILAFRESTKVAYGAAASHFNQNNQGQRPLTEKGVQAPTLSSFKFDHFADLRSGLTGIRAVPIGTVGGISKMLALNFGLRTARAGEVPEGFTGGND